QPWLQLEWTAQQQIEEIVLILDDDVEQDLINLHHHRTSWEVSPSLISRLQVDTWTDGSWRTIAELTENRLRRVCITLPETVTTDRLRIRALEVGDIREARIIAARAYAPRQLRTTTFESSATS
ncbi:hypothetical protein ACT3SQ_19295, partial [Brachybacterium sp. AOP42-C2-15]